jgi:phosphatidylserine synthase 2
MLALALVYELMLVFLLFQNKSDARRWLKVIDSSLGVPLPERSYAENCSFTWNNIYVISLH